MYNNLFNFRITSYSVLIIIFSIILLSCSSAPKPPECINEGTKKSVLKWGKLKNGEQVEYHLMKMNGEISSFDISQSDDNKQEIFYAQKDSICTLLQEMGRLIIEIQTLNVPAESNYFFEYKNEEKNYYFRAVWDPKFENEGNIDFMNFYNRLENITKKL
jgi:hypothetical protein